MSGAGQPADLAERFRPVFARIAAGALDREGGSDPRGGI
jgi:hypothetical protein